MEGVDNLYCKYTFNYGPDWESSHGFENGISQIAERGTGAQQDVYVWNYPLDISFKSCNMFGWPQIVMSVYGINAFGKDVIRGYGSLHLPVSPGRHVKYIRLYTPMSSSKCQQLTSWLTSNPPEFFTAKFTAQARGREVTRVHSKGMVKLVLNVTTRNVEQWGYITTGPQSAPMYAMQMMESSEKQAKATDDTDTALKDEDDSDDTAAPRRRPSSSEGLRSRLGKSGSSKAPKGSSKRERDRSDVISRRKLSPDADRSEK